MNVIYCRSRCTSFKLLRRCFIIWSYYRQRLCHHQTIFQGWVRSHYYWMILDSQVWLHDMQVWSYQYRWYFMVDVNCTIIEWCFIVDFGCIMVGRFFMVVFDCIVIKQCFVIEWCCIIKFKHIMVKGSFMVRLDHIMVRMLQVLVQLLDQLIGPCIN